MRVFASSFVLTAALVSAQQQCVGECEQQCYATNIPGGHEHAQCGGKEFKGLTTCNTGLVCVKQNDYNSQCMKPMNQPCVRVLGTARCCALHIANNFRKTHGKKPMTYRQDKQDCADNVAQYERRFGPHSAGTKFNCGGAAAVDVGPNDQYPKNLPFEIIERVIASAKNEGCPDCSCGNCSALLDYDSMVIGGIFDPTAPIPAIRDGTFANIRYYNKSATEDMAAAVTSLASSGHMSVLGGSVVDGKCEYADTTNGGAKSPAATSPHVVSGRYCGVSEKMFAGGASCGACYKVSYSGEGGTNPGRAGSAVVQVVNQASEVFACHKDVFQAITGATTGIFPITYTEVACEVESAVGVATVLDGKNAYYTKAIFSDLPHAVTSAKLKIGKKSFLMDRVAGATFKANTDGDVASASFELTLADGSTNELTPCFESWPVATGSSCAPKADILV